jgi:geranylgeranyl pyrophosphate synthase
MRNAQHPGAEDALSQYRQRVEDGIATLLPEASTEPASIHQAMRYSLAAGGKRLRPVLVLAAADLYPQRADPLPAAVAVECLHTYSLVHDDLPAMDNSPLRRGQPATHVAFDEATAVLTGDALLTESFRLLAHHYGSEPAVCVALVQTLATAADSRHLIGGQVVDTLSENTRVSGDRLDYIHRRKTAALITAALEMGIHVTEAPPEALETIRRVGAALGLAFQIIDDILDATSSDEVLGKTSGNDARMAKNTYVSIHGLEASRSAAREQTARAIDACAGLPSDRTAFLQGLIRKLEFRIK